MARLSIIFCFLAVANCASNSNNATSQSPFPEVQILPPVPPMLDDALRDAWAQRSWASGRRLQNSSSVQIGLLTWDKIWSSLPEAQRIASQHNNSVSDSVAKYGAPNSEYCAQKCPEWCWASCICMVRGEPCGDECQYVSRKVQPQQQCCSVGCDGPCGQAAGSDTDIMVYSGGKLEEQPLNEAFLQQQLAAGKWVIALISWDSSGGHAVVVAGGSQAGYTINDPLYGTMTKSYANLMRYDGRGRWTGTVYLM